MQSSHWFFLLLEQKVRRFPWRSSWWGGTDQQVAKTKFQQSFLPLRKGWRLASGSFGWACRGIQVWYWPSRKGQVGLPHRCSPCLRRCSNRGKAAWCPSYSWCRIHSPLEGRMNGWLNLNHRARGVYSRSSAFLGMRNCQSPAPKSEKRNTGLKRRTFLYFQDRRNNGR